MLSSNLFFSNDIPFISFSVSHLVAIVVFIACLLVFAKSARQLNDHQNLLLTRAASIFLSLTVLGLSLIHI